MNEIKQIAKRLRALSNMAAFCRANLIAYRTAQRIRGGAKTANTGTVATIERALNKDAK